MPRPRYGNRLKKLIRIYEGKCYYCGRQTTRKDSRDPHRPTDATADHKTPLSRGGSNLPDNVVLACHQCNNFKDDMTEEEFRLVAPMKHNGILLP